MLNKAILNGRLTARPRKSPQRASRADLKKSMARTTSLLIEGYASQ